MFNIDLNYLREALIPIKLRKQNFLYLLRVLYKSLFTVQNTFNQFFNTIKYDLDFNGQVIYLEHLLNDKFDSTERRIYITDADNLPLPYLFNKIEENEPIYIFNKSELETPLYLYNNQEYITDNDFTVVLPIGLSYDLNYLKSLINKFKIAGVRYNIIEL